MPQTTSPPQPMTTAPPTTVKLLSQSTDPEGVCRVRLAVPGTDYKLYLVTDKALDAEPGDRLSGRVWCEARKVMVMPAGGRFIEPGEGRPRRIQARIVGGNLTRNSLVLQAGPGLWLDAILKAPGQTADQFMVGQLIGFDVFAGARFEVGEGRA